MHPLLQRMLLASQVRSIPFRRASAQQALILTNVTTLVQATLAYIMRSSQIGCSTVDLCHCYWLNTLSLHYIHIIQSIMLRRRCQILIFFTKFLRILSPKRVCFQWKLLQVHVLTPQSSCMMKVTHLHALQAWTQSQNLCLIDSLVLGRQKNTLVADGSWSNAGSPFIEHGRLVPNGSLKSSFIARAHMIPNL